MAGALYNSYYDPESVIAFELGSKNVMLDRIQEALAARTASLSSPQMSTSLSIGLSRCPSSFAGRWWTAATTRHSGTAACTSAACTRLSGTSWVATSTRPVAAARRAFDDGAWATMKPNQREQILWRIGDLLELIEEILTFSRLEAGEERLDLESVQPDALVREVQALMEPLALGKGLGFACEAPSGEVFTMTFRPG